MPVDPPDTDPADQDPRERGLSRRSQAGALSPWLIVAIILLLGLAIYAGSALIG